MDFQLIDPGFRMLFDYWAGKRAGRLMPSRGDIDAVELPVSLWPQITLLDVVRNGDDLRFRYRRVGAAFVDAMGRDPTGRFIDETLTTRGRYQEYVISIYREIVAARQAMYSENTFWSDGAAQPHRWTQRLALPLSSDGETVDVVLAAHLFQYASKLGRHAPAESSQFMEGTRILLQP
jgi:hypothetical protein